MTDEEIKEMARMIIRHDDYFYELSCYELRCLYGAKEHEVIPSTCCCARHEARRIVGEPEASKISIKGMKRE